MRLWIAALVLLLPGVAHGQILRADQDARLKAIIVQLDAEAKRCSLAANDKNLEGPAKLQLELDHRGKIRRLRVIDQLRRTDVGKCIAAFRPTEPIPSARFRGGKTIRLEFDFHPWAKRSKRTWTAVRKQLRETEVEAAFANCVKEVGEDRPKQVELAMTIAMSGDVAVDGDDTPLTSCFAEAVSALRFEPSETNYRVEYVWGPSWKKPTRATGYVTEPAECELEEFPCSWAEADPSRVHLGNDYLRTLKEKIDCARPQEAIAWLEKQPHVRWVRSNGCDVNVLIDGARPMTYFGN